MFTNLMNREYYKSKDQNYIYSEMEGRMIPKGFVRKYSRGDEVIIGKEHYTWNEDECAYLSDDVDDSYIESYEIEKPYMKYRWGELVARVDFIIC